MLACSRFKERKNRPMVPKSLLLFSKGISKFIWMALISPYICLERGSYCMLLLLVSGMPYTAWSE